LSEVKAAVDGHHARDTGFCPGTAELATDNPMLLYPAVKIVRDMRKRVPAG
jgi:hypothetical protein